MNEGWIKIYGKIVDWEWYGDPNMVATWLHLLVSANWRDKNWRGFIVRRGQIITSISKLSEAIGQTERQTRLCIERLVDSGQIVKQTTNKYTIITICNYDSYQEKPEQQCQTNDKQGVTQTSDKSQTNDKQGVTQTSTTKEDKNIEDKKVRSKDGGKSARAEKFAPLNQNDIAFDKFYESHFGTKYVWQEDTSEVVARIAQCIADKMAEQGGEIVDMPDQIMVFLEAVYRLDDGWINERFTPQLLAKQFNVLYQRIKNSKNGRNGKNATGVSADYLNRITSELLS